MWKLQSSLMTLLWNGLFLNRRFGDGEFVLDADVAVLLVLLLVARKALHDFGLADHLLRKVVQRKLSCSLKYFIVSLSISA